MGLNERVTSKINVTAPNHVHTVPGGSYFLEENNDIEARVVRLHLLEHFCELAAQELCEAGQVSILKGGRIEALADDLFEDYLGFIVDGVDVFSHSEYYMKETLDKYRLRPVVNGQMNASENERTEGLPEGWWYDFPGHAHKVFPFGRLCIDEDECIRIGKYACNDYENNDCLDMLELTVRGDYSRVCKLYPDYAAEIIQACEFVYTQGHI